MKQNFFFVLALGVTVLSACNNSSDTRMASPDSSGMHNQPPSQDSSSMQANLMKPMNDMMSKAQAMQMTGDFDVDFANMMINHHQGALDMAQMEIVSGKNAAMKAKAQEILDKQKKEQQELRDFVSSYKPSGMKHGEGDLQKGMGTMQDKMKSMHMTGDVDKDFGNMMIVHHQDGISMAEMELKNGMSGKLKQMAQKIITDQRKDIQEFHRLLSAKP